MEFKTQQELIDYIKLIDPLGNKFNSNLHITVPYLEKCLQSCTERLKIFCSSLIVLDIRHLCSRNQNIKDSFIVHCLQFLLESFDLKDEKACQKYHYLLYSVSDSYKELQNFSSENISLFSQSFRSSLQDEGTLSSSFLSQSIKLLLSDFLTKDYLYQIVTLKVDHYFTFVFFKLFEKNDPCGVYICDSTLENGSIIFEAFREHLNFVIFPSLTRQKDGFTCSIFALLDIEIICESIENDNFMTFVENASFAPEMMIYCQNDQSFQHFILNYCPQHLVQSITEQYQQNINLDSKNMYCFRKLCSLVL